MPYATQAQLSERYGDKMLRDLTDRATPPAGAIDTSVVDQALADTDALIDGYLAPRYALPLSETPALIRGLALTIAIYKLHARTVSDKIAADYKEAVNTLKEISRGNVKLANLSGAEPEGSGSEGVRTCDRDRDFTPDNLKGFV